MAAPPPSPSCWNGLKQSSSKGPETPSKKSKQQPPSTDPTDSNSNPISPVPSDIELEEANNLEHCQSESYHWCEEDDLTSSEAVTTSTDKTLASSSDHSAEEYVELAKAADTNLAHIDMEDFKSADLFQSEQIRSLLIEYRQRNNRPVSRSQSPLSQDDCSLTDCGSLCKSGPLFSPQRAIASLPGGLPPDYSTDSLNLIERDECWLLQTEETTVGASQLLCRTNMTNYTLAWSSASIGTDQDVEFNEPGTSSSGSEQSRDWSSSGSGGGRVAPPIPPWPAAPRQCTGTWAADPSMQCWVSRGSSNNHPVVVNKKLSPVTARKSRKQSPGASKEDRRIELIHFRDTVAIKSDDQNGSNPSLSDMDNGNEKAASSNRSKKPVFNKTEAKSSTSTTPPSSGLSLLQIYMRQKSQTSMERESGIKKTTPDDVIASGGGEGWVEEYPSSADEKIGLESITSSLADVGDEDVDDDNEESDDDDLCENNVRSLTLTDVSDIEQTSIQIDAVPFNNVDEQQHSPASSLDKLIAKIKPFELGLSPASMEEHWNFESRLNRTGQDKGCQATIHPPSSATHEESTSTDPIKPETYVIFPSYSLPDLSFLKKHDYTWIGDVLLSPQTISTRVPPPPAPPQRNFDELKKRQLGHVKDWESLNILLPEEIRQQINSAKIPSARIAKPRPKSCDHNNVILRDSKSNNQRPTSLKGISTLPAVPQSPPGPPPLPKRTASLPQSPVPLRQHRQGTAPALVSATKSPTKAGSGYTMRKTVSFGEHLSGGFLKLGSQKRPLSLSQWSGGDSLDVDSPEEDSRCASVNLEQKEELVRNVSLAAAQLCKIMNQAGRDEDGRGKLIARSLSSQLSPAIYQLLSDGLLPNVNTFFGQVINSVWRVVEASVKKGPMLPWIEELVLCLNSEDNLPEGPIRFGVFITELVNMGGLEWWLDNLSAKEQILRRHYSPNGFLYLCHTSTRSLMEEVRAALRPLSSLPLESNAVPSKTTVKAAAPSSPARSSSSSSNKSTTMNPKGSPARPKPQRPMSFVQNSSPTKKGPPHQYRRTQSQHSGLSPKKFGQLNSQQQQPDKAEIKVDELRQKWESLCRDKKTIGGDESAANKTSTVPVAQLSVDNSVKSRIPRPVFRSNK